MSVLDTPPPYLQLIKVEVWDIPGGIDHELVAIVKSVQMTGTELRDQDDRVLLRWDSVLSGWVGPRDRRWSDFTIEATT